MRYDKNRSTISRQDNEQLALSKVFIVGSGGLGGYVLEMLARIGVGHISLADGDVFDDTNLNRQILSSEDVLGQKKVEVAKKRVRRINSDVVLNTYDDYITRENVVERLQGHDVVVDALDNIETRFLLQEACEELGIPLIHGAIAGWFGQVATIFPGDRTLDSIYQHQEKTGVETTLGNLSFPPALVASLQVAETIKVLLHRGETLRRKIMFLDLLTQDVHVFELDSSDA